MTVEVLITGFVLAVLVVGLYRTTLAHKRAVDNALILVQRAEIDALRDEIARQSQTITRQYAEITTLRSVVSLSTKTRPGEERL